MTIITPIITATTAPITAPTVQGRTQLGLTVLVDVLDSITNKQ